jgi:excisionase family DNA binding protein
MVARLLTYKELSERWKVPENTLMIWVMEKRLKPIKLGRLVRFLESYIAEIETRGYFV